MRSILALGTVLTFLALGCAGQIGTRGLAFPIPPSVPDLPLDRTDTPYGPLISLPREESVSPPIVLWSTPAWDAYLENIAQHLLRERQLECAVRRANGETGECHPK